MKHGSILIYHDTAFPNGCLVRPNRNGAKKEAHGKTGNGKGTTDYDDVVLLVRDFLDV